MKHVKPIAGRKGCGGCHSESHESMQFNGPIPGDSFIKPIYSEMPGTRNDLREICQLDGRDHAFSFSRQLEEVFA